MMAASMKKPEPEHKDTLGQVLNVDDFVAYPSHNSLSIGKVIKLNNKMVKVIKLPSSSRSDGQNKYPRDVVKVDPAYVTIYLLKHSK